MAKKIYVVDNDIKQATQVFDEKVAFYAEKESLARIRIQENLNQNRLKSHRAIGQYQFETEVLKIQTKRHAKQADRLCTHRVKRLEFHEKLAKIPLQWDTKKTINRRKKQAKHAWAIKQNKLIH
jgi:hypothetical protein